MTTKELLDIRKATNDLMELSKRVRNETEVVQCCLRDLDDIAHEVQNLAYDMGVDAADLSEEEEPDMIRPDKLESVADRATGVSGLFMNRAIDFLAEIGARLKSAPEDEMNPDPNFEPLKVTYRNRFELALYALSQADTLLGKERFQSPYSEPMPF